ncbi:MAG: hypothetical protein ACLQD8_05990 [Thermoplasmata archaeon]
MSREGPDRLQRIVLLHLLEHRGQQVRFEASHWATEIGILRRFPDEDPALMKVAIRSLEMTRMIYRRIQYVVGYSEPKHVFSLTPSGHRKAIEFQLEGSGSPEHGVPDDLPPHIPEPDDQWNGRAPEPSA